jgi:hypothetical protein
MHPVITQAIYYGIVMILSVLLISFLQRGFFWKYVKVRASFGKYVLVKLRAVNRDFFAVGWVEDNFLVYKSHGQRRQHSLQKAGSKAFYKSLGVTWIDIDETTNGIGLHDYSTATGYDAATFSNLYERTLYAPEVKDPKEKIMFVLIIGGAIASIAAAIMAFMAMQGNVDLTDQITKLVKIIAEKAVVTGGKGV